MKPELVDYLKGQVPRIDVLGRWAYLPNARTGSTSIANGVLSDRAVMYHRGPDNWKRVWNKIIEPRIDDVVFFTFVRNPWARAVSAWRFLLEHRRIDADSFTDFLDNGALSDPEHEHFFRPQSATFMRGGSRIPGVVVGRYETMKEDWKRIAERIGVVAQLPRQNATTHGPYWEYYDTRSVKMVGLAYATEIAALGYEFAE